MRWLTSPGWGFPPVMGHIEDATNSYNDGLLIVAGALILGGILGLIVGRKRAIEGATASPPKLELRL